LAIIAGAQPPQAFKYQTVVRDGAGEILQNQEVALRMSIHDATAGGTIIYQEIFSETTNQFGLVSLEIGRGTPTIETFDGIDWAVNPKFLEVEIDPEGGGSYVSLGTSELVSVPYAMHAETVTNVDDADADPGNELNTSVSLDGTDLKVTDADGTITTDLSSLVDDADADPVNEIQTLSIVGNDLSISNGNVVPLPSGMPAGTTGQTINHDGSGWAASNNLYNDGTNVGIGTTTPGSKLEVAGTVRANRFSDAQDASFYIDPSGYPTSGVLNGHLGIGGAPYWVQGFPGTPGWGPNLHINTGQDTAYLWLGGNISQAGADVGHISFIGEWNNPNLFGDKSSRYASITGKIISSGSSSSYPTGALIFSTASGGNPLEWPPTTTGFEEQMRITHEGLVGIGTIDPWYKLHVEEGEIYVNNPGGGGYDGVHVENAGGHGFSVWDAGTHGLNVHNSGNHGVNVTQAGDDGVHVVAADDCGIDAEGDHGNHLRSYSSGYYGLYAHSLFDETTNPGLYVYGTAYITGNLTAQAYNGSGAGLTNINASNISLGTLNNNRFNALSDLGGGSGTTFLRKDGSWATPTSTTYSAGNDLNLNGATFSLDNDIDVNYVRATGSNGLKLFDDGGNGIFIEDGGNVGIGTTTPATKLDVNGDNEYIRQSAGSNPSRWIQMGYHSSIGPLLQGDGYQRLTLDADAGAAGEIILGVGGDNVGIGEINPSYPLHMASGARCTSGGVWTNASSKALKENIHDLSLEEAMDAFDQLNPKKYNYKLEKDETYLGFIAEEVPELVAVNDRDALSPMDIIAVLTKVLQQQQKETRELKSENQTLKARIEKLENK